MKFSFSFFHIITFIKKRPERIILWFFLATFIFLCLYLVISWPKGKKEAALFLEELAIKGMRREPVTEATPLVDFQDILTRKPFTHYSHLIRRDPFVRLPEVVAPIPTGEENDNGPLPPPPPLLPPQLEVGLIYRGITRTPEGPMALIEGREATHWVREGDEVEGWKIIKIDKEEIKLYNEPRKKEIVLPLGGVPEERERTRREAEERRQKRQERQPERPGEEDREGLEILPRLEEFLPELPPADNR